MSSNAILIAKRASEKGSIAFRTAVTASRRTGNPAWRETINRGIEILTVSSSEVWDEYGPYNFVESEAEFVIKVRAMERNRLIALSQK